MNRYDLLPQLCNGHTALKTILARLLTLSAIIVAGCSDYRMTLDQFIALQESKTDSAASQTAAPEPLSDEEKARIDQELGHYRIGPGDEITVNITAPDVETSGGPTTIHVNKNGEIRLPKMNEIKIGGLDLEDAETRILDSLIEQQIYVDRKGVIVHITVVNPETTDVLVTGAAGSPGLVRLRRTERNLLNAVVAAGGISQASSGDITLKRLRNPDETVTVNLLDPAQLRTSLAMNPLESGDIVEVHAALPNTLFVGGLVNSPGPQPYPAGANMNVLQALAAAGGLRTDLTPREATLIRRINGKDYHVKLNLDKMTVAQAPNIMMAAGDVLWIPYSVETRIQDWINKNVFVRVGANATYNLNYDHRGEDYLNNAARKHAQQFSNNGSSSLQDRVDPFGFLQQNQALNALQR